MSPREPAAASLTLVPGEEAVTPGRTITESDLVSFASLTGDWHPQHSDAAWAAESRFGARVAHGMMLLSYAVGLFPFDPERVVALRGLDSISFKRPVHIGDTIRVASKAESARELDTEHSLVTLSWRILNQDDRLVARARVNALVRTGAEARMANGEATAAPAAGTATAEDPPSAAVPPSAALALGDLYGDTLAL